MIKYLRFLYDLFEDFCYSKINPKRLISGQGKRKTLALCSLTLGNRGVQQFSQPFNLFKINIMKNSLKKSPLVAILVCCSIFLMANQSFAQKLSVQKMDNNSVQKETERIVKAQQNLENIFESNKNNLEFKQEISNLFQQYSNKLGFIGTNGFLDKSEKELFKMSQYYPREIEQFCVQLEKIIYYHTKKKK